MAEAMPRRTLGVIYGSRSMEHGVSILTAHQAMSALDKSKYAVQAIYITESGQWLASDTVDDLSKVPGLPLDAGPYERAFRAHARPAVIVPDPSVGGLISLDTGRLFRRAAERTHLDAILIALHGTNGEDGSIQGLLELAGIPYTGSGVVGSTLGMDKLAMKELWQAAGLPVLPYHGLTRYEWETAREAQLDTINAKLSYPIFVKPAGLGSSIGISRTVNREDLGFALDVAANYDRRLIVEQGLEGATEINCSVLGFNDVVASPCERPLASGQLLSYDDKYLHSKAGKHGGDSGMQAMIRELPAAIPDAQATRIQQLAVAAFKSLDCAGVARVDTLVAADGSVYLNEINTVPGSLASYLWEAGGMSFSALLDRLVDIAIEAAREKRRTRYSTRSS